MTKLNVINKLEDVQRKGEELTVLMAQCIEKFDEKLFELIGKTVIRYKNEEEKDGYYYDMWFQENYMLISIKKSTPKRNIRVEFNVHRFENGEVSEWFKIDSFIDFEKKIEFAKKLCKSFLERDIKEINKECVKCTDSKMYDTLYNNEKLSLYIQEK